MSNVHILIVAVLLLPAVAATWLIWCEVRDIEMELAEFEGFKGIVFDR